MASHSDDDGADPHLFSGVRFALVGFDHVSRSQYRVEMQRAGATDVEDWRLRDCTHVIVYDLLYDDPVCVAARNDGKKVVTEQWVDDSFDLGELADADRVLYSPVRDVTGIPGSDSLTICLTGYQKNQRQDIMRMVSLMGAEFSKSLAAGKVTHLVCYKFEGEKYDLAKQVNIKLVNHRWLEDCLKAWKILPIDNYKKSGWEIEIMETQVKDSEDEAEDASAGPSNSRRICGSTPVTEIRMRTHVDSDANAPTRVPSIASSNAEGAAGRHPGNAPNSNGVILSVGRRANSSGIDEGPANQVTRDEAEDDHSGAPEIRSAACCTPSIYKSNATPIQVDSIENIDANCLQNSKEIASNPSEEKLFRTTLFSPESSRKADQKDDRRTHDLKSIVSQEKQKLCKSNARSEGKSCASVTLGYSRRRSSKTVSPDPNLGSKKQTSSPHSSEGKTSRLEFNTPSRKSDQDFSEPADVQRLQEAEVRKHVDTSSSAHSQRKSILSSVSPKTPNGDPGLGTHLIPSKECASEGATVSNLDSDSPEGNKVDGHLNSGLTVNFKDKQMSHSFKSNLLSSRRTHLKLVSPGEVKRLPENYSNDNNMGALGEVKAPALHEAAAEKDCPKCPSVNSEVRKESSGVSLQENAEVSDAKQVHKVDVVALISKLDMEVPHQTLEAGPKDIPVNAVIGKDSTAPAKVLTSRLKNAGAKRSRNAGSKTASAVAKRKHEIAASRPMQDKACPCENGETQQGEKYSSPNADESVPVSPVEILNGKPRNKTAKAELDNLFPQKDVKEDHKKLSNIVSADENLEKSSQKILDSIARNSVAEVPQNADGSMADSPTTEKSETMSLKSNFNEVVPPENRETFPKKLSSSASADDSEIPNQRVRKAVAKRKMSSVQKQKFDSEPCKTAGVFVAKVKPVSSERAAQSSRNSGNATMDQDVQKTNEKNDPVGSFCNDTMDDKLKGTHQSYESRSKKRQKTFDLVDGSLDHDKENIPISRNLTLKTKYGNNNTRSKFITKALPNGKAVLDENRMVKGNDCGTLNVLEPTWFILSGHRLLRKEYKSILTRLKGRVCRDSHHWSFQATHLVATELRRTEKLFAAAAAGRWILKPDYLTACMEAGKFLGEEPFEWHGDGLNSNETISLDAPRKWRQHKQQTGHGAFFGMQIIIYGECIAPTLDTLKRAIRAGDGTILATSPPYTRSFKSDVDFAVVSADMPSVDAWVQEFMRHQIPCVSADYLVEYVCKPGHSLSKHVLFEMHDLAEKSLGKLLKKQHNGVTGEAADVVCSTCGSNDRDRPMLVCGSDGNSTICGSNDRLRGCGACRLQQSAR